MNRDKIIKMGWKLVGQAGVDSGQIMIIDPAYVLSKTEYQALFKVMEKNRHEPSSFKNGVVSHTWIGDGNYHVYVMKDKAGRVERMMIDFKTTYGFDDTDKNMHDIDMEDLAKRVWENASKK